MAMAIKVYEKDRYLYTLIKRKLSYLFPDAHIVNSDDYMESSDLLTFVVSIYDSQFYSAEDIKDSNSISYRENKIIDMEDMYKRISSLNLFSSGESITNKSSTNKLYLLIPFTYIEEREKFISSFYQESNLYTDGLIRIDLMSGIRMPRRFHSISTRGSLSKLLRDSMVKSFSYERIPEYLIPDIDGILTPGLPDNADDVFDIGISASINLISKMKELIHDSNSNYDGLITAEGFKIQELSSLASLVNDVHILLPSRKCDENLGIGEAVSQITRRLTEDSNVTIHYFEDFKRESNLCIPTH